jgi:hypothetical protein
MGARRGVEKPVICLSLKSWRKKLKQTEEMK